jgi:chromosome segregation ATPase
VNAVAKSVSDQSKGAVTDHDRITALLKRTEDESNTQIERIGRIEEQGDSLKVLVAKLTEDVKGREAEIARAPQVIADAKKMTDTAAGYAADLNKLQDQLADLKDGVKKAGDGLAATKHALDDATNASERLTPVRLRVLALQPVVDAIDNRAGALSVSLDGAAKDLVGITKSKQFLQETNLDLALLRVDIDRMTKARDELQRRLDSLQPPPEPNKPRSSDATPVDNTGNSGKSQAESPIDHLQFNDIINIQKALARKKLYLGRIDGIMGPGTSQAIGKYQQSINADQSGKITASQRDLLLNDRQS